MMFDTKLLALCTKINIGISTSDEIDILTIG